MWEEEFIILDSTSFPMKRTRGATLGVVGAVCGRGYERNLLDPVSRHLLIATPVGFVASGGESNR